MLFSSVGNGAGIGIKWELPHGMGIVIAFPLTCTTSPYLYYVTSPVLRHLYVLRHITCTTSPYLYYVTSMYYVTSPVLRHLHVLRHLTCTTSPHLYYVTLPVLRHVPVSKATRTTDQVVALAQHHS